MCVCAAQPKQPAPYVVRVGSWPHFNHNILSFAGKLTQHKSIVRDAEERDVLRGKRRLRLEQGKWRHYSVRISRATIQPSKMKMGGKLSTSMWTGQWQQARDAHKTYPQTKYMYGPNPKIIKPHMTHKSWWLWRWSTKRMLADTLTRTHHTQTRTDNTNNVARNCYVKILLDQ